MTLSSMGKVDMVCHVMIMCFYDYGGILHPYSDFMFTHAIQAE